MDIYLNMPTMTIIYFPGKHLLLVFPGKYVLSLGLLCFAFVRNGPI